MKTAVVHEHCTEDDQSLGGGGYLVCRDPSAAPAITIDLLRVYTKYIIVIWRHLKCILKPTHIKSSLVILLKCNIKLN